MQNEYLFFFSVVDSVVEFRIGSIFIYFILLIGFKPYMMSLDDFANVLTIWWILMKMFGWCWSMTTLPNFGETKLK